MSMMRAVVVEVGSPNRLALRDVEEASPSPSEALIRVAAVSLNRGEVRRAQATTQAGFRPGWDVAGTVERAAQDGSGPPEGSHAVGLLEAGAWAELAAVPMRSLAPGCRRDFAAAHRAGGAVGRDRGCCRSPSRAGLRRQGGAPRRISQ